MMTLFDNTKQRAHHLMERTQPFRSLQYWEIRSVSHDFGSINRSLIASNCLCRNFNSVVYFSSSSARAFFSFSKSSRLICNRFRSFSFPSTFCSFTCSSSFFNSIFSCNAMRSSLLCSASLSNLSFSSSRTPRSTLSSSHFFLSFAHSASSAVMAEVHSSMDCSSFFTAESASLILVAFALASSSALSALFWTDSIDFLSSSICLLRSVIFSSISNWILLNASPLLISACFFTFSASCPSNILGITLLALRLLLTILSSTGAMILNE
mmetsp:Transcript_14218/g.34368  ORF Transcript_14218/g.34368 Transcript_14218/m.34368 type:complete len:267 (+) Transcript_14218:231-1031(+)